MLNSMGKEKGKKATVAKIHTDITTIIFGLSDKAAEASLHTIATPREKIMQICHNYDTYVSE